MHVGNHAVPTASLNQHLVKMVASFKLYSYIASYSYRPACMHVCMGHAGFDALKFIVAIATLYA